MQLYDLIAKLKTIEEADTIGQGGSASQPTRPTGNINAPLKGPSMPDQPINRIQQNVKPQADRPGLAPNGDPKLYDIQVWLNQHGYKIATDGLNGPQTKKAYDQAQNLHNNVQNAQNPDTANVARQIGNAIGSGVDWIETAWRNLKQGFIGSSPSAPPTMEANIQDLAEKMRRLDEGLEIMPMMPGQQSQQDNVSMSINVNGQGEGGIRSIMNILRDIEGNDSHGHDEKLMGEPARHDKEEPVMGDIVKDMLDNMNNDQGLESPFSDAPEEEMEEANENDDKETWANSAHGDAGHHIHGVDAVTFSGDDMNSKGKISPLQRAPGTNSLREPSNFDESLVRRLSDHYASIKEAGDKKTMSRAAKGVMKYGKDGMQALAKAGKEGKDLDKVRDKYNKYD
jgi:hypothetical protein